MTVPLVSRPRLLELMAARWHTGAVSLTAGPGFGKSVLLEQTLAENRLSPRGVDVAVVCRPNDQSPLRLLGRIAQTAGLEACPPSVEGLLCELSKRWPLGVCVLLDDVHLLGEDSDGARVVSALVSQTAPPVHIVLAGRRRLRGLSGARMSGELVELDEDDLVLTEAEIAELASLHDADPSTLAPFGGWPAAVAIAAVYDIAGADDYVREAVLDHLEPGQRRLLAVAAALGGVDDDLLRRAIDDPCLDPAEVLADLPLVRRSAQGSFEVHDLWRRVVGNPDDGDVDGCVMSAVDVLIERDEFDRGFRLCVDHQDWDRAAGVLHACCRRGHSEVPSELLTEWLAAWPDERRDSPDELLLRGLLGRVNDPFGPATAELLEGSLEGYRAVGNVPGEIAAGVELVYVLRNQGRFDVILTFLARALELDAAGHAAAAGPAAMARALSAELAGDDREFLARLDSIPPASLSQGWETVIAFRRTVSHLILGDERQMLEAAERCAALAGESNDRHVLALAQWFAGDPSLALDTCDEIVAGAARSQVDGVFLGTIASLVLAHAGRVDDAIAQLDATMRAAAGPLSPLLEGAVLGVRALLAVATGDDEAARQLLSDAVCQHPLDDRTGWRMAARWLPLAYVLVPSTRRHLDRQELGTVHRRRIAVARAVAAVRDGRGVSREQLCEVTPQTVATTVPLPWAMALASRIANDGDPFGRRLAEYLLELYGEPAKQALRATTEHPSRPVAAGARKLLGDVVVAPRHQIRLDVLGPVELRVGDGVASNLHWNRDRVRSLLLYLALHTPCQREQVAEALWPRLDPDAADRNLRVTLTYLQQVLEPDRRKGEASYFVQQVGSTLALAGEPCFSADAREFERVTASAEDADHRGVPSAALDLFEHALSLWRGPCLSDVAYEEWAQAACQRLSGGYVAAATRAAELRLAGGGHAAATRLASRVLEVDPWHEPAHCLLVAAALASGDAARAARAMADLDAMLTDLGLAPSRQTDQLRRCLDERRVRHVAIA